MKHDVKWLREYVCDLARSRPITPQQVGMQSAMAYAEHMARWRTDEPERDDQYEVAIVTADDDVDRALVGWWGGRWCTEDRVIGWRELVALPEVGS